MPGALELMYQRRRGLDQVRMASGRLVPRRQVVVCPRIPADARRDDLGHHPRAIAYRLRAACEGKLN